MEIEKLLTIDDVCTILKVKSSWVRNAIFRREIRYRKVGSLVRFSLSDINDFIISSKKYHT